jgi:hypothetical protein
MEGLAQLIDAFAALMWPLTVLLVIYLFREPLKALIPRIQKGKIAGLEVELQELQEQAQAAAAEIPTSAGQLEEKQTQGTGALLPDQTSDEAGLFRRVLVETERSPKLAVIMLATEMEDEVRRLLASTGWLAKARSGSLPDAISVLLENGTMPPSLAGSVKLFWDIRNRIVHGHGAEKDDILSAIDSGFTILRAIRAIPHTVNTVYHPGVDVYADADGERLRPGVKAVILESTSPGGAGTTRRAFPTTKDHFVAGRAVAWEWGFGKVWGESWYRDPDTGEIKHGWGASAEFVGRLLDDV